MLRAIQEDLAVGWDRCLFVCSVVHGCGCGCGAVITRVLRATEMAFASCVELHAAWQLSQFSPAALLSVIWFIRKVGSLRPAGLACVLIKVLLGG